MSTKWSKFKKIFAFFAVIFIAFCILLSPLFYGINLSNLKFKNFQIEQLYIKLDKKLILRAKNISVLTQNKKQSSLNDFSSYIDKIFWINALFKDILIENLRFENYKLNLRFSNGHFYVDSPLLLINTAFSKIKNKTIIDVKNLAFKDFNISIQGTANADIMRKIYDFNGTFLSHELSGCVSLKLKQNILNYKIFDAKAKSIKNLIDEIKGKKWLTNEVANWIYGNIVANDYEFKEVSGKIDIKHNKFFLNKMRGLAFAKNLRIKFHPKVAPVLVKSARVMLKNETLSFKLNHPIFKNASLKNSSVKINHLFENDANIDINIKTNSPLNNDIGEILSAFDIDIPIRQNSGALDTKLHLNIVFEPFNIQAFGKFALNDANISIANAPFFSKNAKISLKNSLINIENSHLKNDFLDINLSALIDTSRKTGAIDAFGDVNLSLKNNNLLQMHQIPLFVDMKFNENNATLHFPAYSANLIFGKMNEFSFKNTNNLLKNSPFLNEIGIKDFRQIWINTADFSAFDIVANDVKFSAPFTHKNGLNYENDDFMLNINDENFTLLSKTAHLELSSNKNGAKNDLNVGLKTIDFIYNFDEKINFLKFGNLRVSAINSDILLSKNKKLIFDEFKGSIDENLSHFIARKNDAKFIYKLDNNAIKLDANNVDSDFINAILGANSFIGGKFDMILMGKGLDDFDAEISAKNTYLADFSAYHQLLTFINSIPALLIFKTPDFNNKGFTIKEGKIYLSKKANKFDLQAMNLKGTSADIFGSGSINLNTNKVNITLELGLLKDATKIISNIPLFNYILLGKDGRISTVIKVSGDVQEPKFQTQILKDTINSPFNLIKNALELPFVIFN